MTNEHKTIFSPKEAAKYLSEKSGRDIDQNRLAQLRRAGKVEAIRLGYNETVFTKEALDKADLSLSRPGRKPKGNNGQSGDESLPTAA